MLHCPTCGGDYSEDLKVCPGDGATLQADVTNVSTPFDPLLGRTLDQKYLLEKQLGVGGMGTVYRARHLLIDRPVAVKVLNQRFVEDEEAQSRFRREAKAAGRLQHPNAVGVTDFGQTEDGYVYIVMELLEGQTLRDLLARDGPLDVAHAVSIMLQVSSAVAAAHEAGIIHRDLKPANIFISQRPDVPSVVKVLDFGIAKLAADSLDEDDRHTLTQVGAMIGTPRYMSPEQCNGSPLTPAADVYSMGVILYEMLTGAVPFSGLSPLAIAMRHSTEAPRRPSEFISSIPAPLEAVVLNALEKRPEDRPRDAGTFRLELLDTAERLGLEHAAASTAPSMEALRSAGTQSPSGRLVIDLGRLRENRAATSSAGELTVIDQVEARRIVDERAAQLAPAPVAAAAKREPPRRFDVRLDGAANASVAVWKKLAIITGALALVLIVSVAFLLGRSRATNGGVSNQAAASPSPQASPTPLPSPSPTPSPSPSPSPKEEAKGDDKKKPAKKDEGGSKLDFMKHPIKGIKGLFKKKP